MQSPCWVTIVAVTLAAALILCACSPAEKPAPAPPAQAPPALEPPRPDQEIAGVTDEESVLAMWHECLAQAEERLDDPACTAIAREVAAIGGPVLEQALQQLADPQLKPHAKVMIVNGFRGYLRTAAAPILKPMTEPREDETTRACATALLAHIPDSDLIAFLVPLIQDENPRVSFAALLGVAAGAQEDSEFRTELKKRYDAPETSANMKQHILDVFMRTALPADVPFLANALQDPALPPSVRIELAAKLGRVGDQRAIEGLLASKAVDTSAEYAETVDLAVAAIRERAASDVSPPDAGDDAEPPAGS